MSDTHCILTWGDRAIGPAGGTEFFATEDEALAHAQEKLFLKPSQIDTLKEFGDVNADPYRSGCDYVAIESCDCGDINSHKEDDHADE